MGAIKIHLHPESSIRFEPIDDLVGIAGLKMFKHADPGGGGQPEEVPVKGLALTDPDGEVHVYAFTEDGRQALIRNLTGGVVLPGG